MDDRFGNSVSMPDDKTIGIGAYGKDGLVTDGGQVKVFSWNNTAWVQKGADILGNVSESQFGFCVSMPDVNTIGIGANYDDAIGQNNSGSASIYAWNSVISAWEQKGTTIYGEGADDYFGHSLSMPDANTVGIGAFYNDGTGNNAGQVRVYAWNSTTNAWEQKGVDIDGEAEGDESGRSVSMPDANTVAIGAPRNDGTAPNAGHVRIYTWNSSTNAWEQKGVDIDGVEQYDQIGWSVEMADANTVAIGAPFKDVGSMELAGQVRIFTWNGSAWVQKGADISGTDWLGLGKSLSMPNADNIIIGCNNSGNFRGQARVYTWNGSAWILKATVDGDANYSYDATSVSMPDNNTFAMGAPSNSEIFTGAGQARIFQFEIPTPLDLLSFSARKQEDHTALLKWSTANERDFSHFEIEHSHDGGSFEKIGEVKAKSIESRNLANYYDYNDKTPVAGNKYSYYRLKQVDLDGSYVYSGIRSVDWAQPGSTDIHIYPNPFTERFTISSGEKISAVQVNDHSGKVIYEEQYNNAALQQMIHLNNASPGTYYLTVYGGVEVHTVKLIKH